jgi:hypothetical protein
VARFRSIKYSEEYDRVISEIQESILKLRMNQPNNPELELIIRKIRTELEIRPIRQ